MRHLHVVTLRLALRTVSILEVFKRGSREDGAAQSSQLEGFDRSSLSKEGRAAACLIEWRAVCRERERLASMYAMPAGHPDPAR